MRWQCEHCGESYQSPPSECVHCGKAALTLSRYSQRPSVARESVAYRRGLAGAVLVLLLLAGLFNPGVVQF